MWLTVLLLGLTVGCALIALAMTTLRSGSLRTGVLFAGVAISLATLVASALLTSVRFVGTDEVGIVKKNALGPSLRDGRIIATEGEMGVQAEVLAPGWHVGYWPILFDVETVPLIEVGSEQIGLVTARDGAPLDPGQVFAPEVSADEFKRMVTDAEYFLSSGGRKGPQSNVLTPGKYRLNTALFQVEMVTQTSVGEDEVGVLKANFGTAPTIRRAVSEGAEETVNLAGENEKGVREVFLEPGKYPVNTRAFEVTRVSTRPTIVRFTSASSAGGVVVERNVNVPGGRGGAARQRQPEDSPRRLSDARQVQAEEREITVRTSDGFTFPVDVRIEYKIRPEDAPVVVRLFGGDGDGLLSKLNATVRAIFRNNAESVTALDYVNQRSQQESRSLDMIKREMESVGVSIVRVSIGDVGNEETLGDLLKTQRDRQIAVEERQTFQLQQEAAEQRKELTRTEQEAEEEKRLATASYEVRIAEQQQQRRIIQAEAEAQAIEIEAAAQAEAFRVIADQVGSANAALIELLEIIGTNAIEITPRVMVNQGGAAPGGTTASGETVALIGTMLDSMLNREELDRARPGRDGSGQDGSSRDRSGRDSVERRPTREPRDGSEAAEGARAAFDR